MRVGVAGLLLLAAAAAACGPGTGGGSHASRRKRTPLVIHQSEPNTFEQHDSAAGKAEGRVRRGDPRFRDLVPNYNRNIVFRDEEGTGVDRLMTQRCKEKLNTLAIAVMNQWPNVQLRVEEGYEDNDDVHQGSLHYEGRAVDVTTSDRDRAKYGMLARLAVEAGFDWVHYESKKHIHCSVKSESSQAGPTGGCFPASSVVRLEGGRTATVSALRIGDRVLSGATAYSEVIAFLDRDENATRSFVRLHLSNGGALTATRAHLLLTATGAPVFAGSVRVGDSLLAPEGAARVVRLQAVWARGVFAPLTRAGTVVVDSALVSCYAGVSSARLAHYALAPLRAWLALLPAGAVQRGVHPYARALQAVGRALLPTSMFYD